MIITTPTAPPAGVPQVDLGWLQIGGWGLQRSFALVQAGDNYYLNRGGEWLDTPWRVEWRTGGGFIAVAAVPHGI